MLSISSGVHEFTFMSICLRGFVMWWKHCECWGADILKSVLGSISSLHPCSFQCYIVVYVIFQGICCNRPPSWTKNSDTWCTPTPLYAWPQHNAEGKLLQIRISLIAENRVFGQAPKTSPQDLHELYSCHSSNGLTGWAVHYWQCQWLHLQ